MVRKGEMRIFFNEIKGLGVFLKPDCGDFSVQNEALSEGSASNASMTNGAKNCESRYRPGCAPRTRTPRPGRRRAQKSPENGAVGGPHRAGLRGGGGVLNRRTFFV